MTAPAAARYDYEAIKRMASNQGKRVTDFLALSMINDPFYVGQKAEVEKARWFAGLWGSGLLAGRTHLRGIHYFLVSRDEPIAMPGGRPYENTDACWAFLGLAVKAARYLDLVDPRAFRDRRSPTPQIFTAEAAAPSISVDGDRYFDLTLPDFPDVPSYRVENFAGTQTYLTEIWIEKSTMEDELLPLCRAYGCNLVTGVGELSITQCIALVDRIIRFARPARVLYVSDFDPAGQSMPVAVARKVEFFQRNECPDLDIEIQQIALTYEQCQAYRLPRTPIKAGERRAAKFEARYGEGATELDALEALYPGELATILRRELERFYDNTLDARSARGAAELRGQLEEVRDGIAEAYAEQIAELQARYERLKDRYDGDLADIAAQVERVWQARGCDGASSGRVAEPLVARSRKGDTPNGKPHSEVVDLPLRLIYRSPAFWPRDARELPQHFRRGVMRWIRATWRMACGTRR